MHRLNEHPRDAVSELLRGVKVHSTVYCLSDLRAPWGFHVEDSAVAKFHLVLEGSCVLALDGGEQVDLGCGDLVLLPTGTGHAVRDRPGSRIRDLERILTDHPLDGDARLSFGGRGRRTRLVCGGFQLADALPSGLLALLPTVVSLDAGPGGLGRWLQPLFELLREEADGRQPGAAAVFTKLADVFLAQALRSYLLGRVRRHERLRERDELRTRGGRLLDQLAGLVDGGLPVQEDRGCLDGGNDRGHW